MSRIRFRTGASINGRLAEIQRILQILDISSQVGIRRFRRIWATWRTNLSRIRFWKRAPIDWSLNGIQRIGQIWHIWSRVQNPTHWANHGHFVDKSVRNPILDMCINPLVRNWNPENPPNLRHCVWTWDPDKSNQILVNFLTRWGPKQSVQISNI